MPNFTGRRFTTIIGTMCRHGSCIDSGLLSPRLPSVQQRFCISKTSRPLSYYEALEITPGANQSQVKKQYYKLSKQYHPDTNKENSAAIKFREISEAYEVLGNITKRRMYDKGLINIGVSSSPAEAEEYSKRFYESRSKRSQAPTASGRTPIYDFDEWSKLHYESTFRRSESGKERVEFLREKKRVDLEESKGESIMVFVMFLVFLVFYQTTVGFFYNNDIVDKDPKKKDKD
ncbi:unnamed protein product [Meganyctiphanes norvegica]|uniref:J domain-containing protein n=1 Tax=Meganyctiphanes norvegica TaxID=48144 RepID=A0AAV2QDK6_MEGNR